MSWLDTIKNAYFNHQQKKISTQTAAPAVGFEQAQSLAFLFMVESEMDSAHILQYAQQVRNMGKEVALLGFYPKNVPDTFPTQFDCLTPKDLSWANVPQGDIANKFTRAGFDICVGIYTQPCPVLDYILKSSPSRLKIGAYKPKQENPYDICIRPTYENLGSFLQELNHLLTTLQIC
jgi:hypothetical protein